jgi:hypothetical protein
MSPRRESINGLAGLALVVLNLLLVSMPGAGALVLGLGLVLWIGAYALGVAMLLVAFGLRLLSLGKRQHRDAKFRAHGPLGTAGGAR